MCLLKIKVLIPLSFWLNSVHGLVCFPLMSADFYMMRDCLSHLNKFSLMVILHLLHSQDVVNTWNAKMVCKTICKKVTGTREGKKEKKLQGPERLFRLLYYSFPPVDLLYSFCLFIVFEREKEHVCAHKCGEGQRVRETEDPKWALRWQQWVRHWARTQTMRSWHEPKQEA